MEPFEVSLSLPVVAPLLDVVKEMADGLKQTLASKPGVPETDAVFRDLWNQELLSTQNEDVTALLSLFNEDFFTEGVVGFDHTNAEAITRACSAIRLRLRERYLAALGQLDPSTRKAFMCYLFLATIQELIIQHLDESIIES
jgi:hypothetical protein